MFSKDSFNFITNNHFDNKKYCNYNNISPSPSSSSSNIDLNSEKTSSSSLYHSKTSDHGLHSVPLQNHESNSSANFLGALKEWAIICKAIEDGRQILLFRKGGIMEFRNGFELKYKNFFLFPTFEHQAKESIRIEYHKELEELEKSDKLNTKKVDTVYNNSTITREITSFVEILDFNEVKNIDDLEKLEQFHIWTDDYLKTRFNYNPKKPLYLLLLRAYKLDVPIRIIDKPEWVGCKSWIQLDPNNRDLTKYFKDHFSETSFEHLKSVSKPCIDDNKFNKLSKEVRSIIL